MTASDSARLQSSTVNNGARANRFTAHLPFLFATVQARIRGLGILVGRPTVSCVHSPQGAASLRLEPVDLVRMLRREPQALREILLVELGVNCRAHRTRSGSTRSCSATLRKLRLFRLRRGVVFGNG